MKVVVFGARGQLGTEVCSVFADEELRALDVEDLDLRDAPAVLLQDV